MIKLLDVSIGCGIKFDISGYPTLPLIIILKLYFNRLHNSLIHFSEMMLNKNQNYKIYHSTKTKHYLDGKFLLIIG